MNILLQSAGYADMVAQAIGGLLLLGVVLYWFVSRQTGREGDEWGHEKAVGKGTKRLDKTRQIRVPRDADIGEYRNDLEYLVEVTDTLQAGGRNVGIRERFANLWTRMGNWRRRRASFGTYIHACPIEDANGRTIHVASVNGRRLAHRNAAQLVGGIETVLEARQEYEQPPATLSEYYYGDISKGFVDIDATKSRVRGDCKTRIQDNMSREGELPKRELIETLVYDSQFRYPEPVVEEKLAELISRDIREHKDGRLEWQRF